jgi:ABC-type lipoprotein export system ATPase subunit
MSLLSVNNVSYSLSSGQKIITGVSFELGDNEALALDGPVGSGKTTLLKIAAGILSPESGKVLYKGRDLALLSKREDLAFRGETGFVFQDAALWGNISIYENLELPLHIHYPGLKEKEKEGRMSEIMEKVGFHRKIRRETRASSLSVGEQKLIAFARAIVCKPKLLFLDEFTTSLDAEAEERLASLCLDFKREGGSLLFVSHKKKLIENLADRVVTVKRIVL